MITPEWRYHGLQLQQGNDITAIIDAGDGSGPQQWHREDVNAAITTRIEAMQQVPPALFNASIDISAPGQPYVMWAVLEELQ